MYDRTAEAYDVFFAARGKDYAAEAEHVADLIRECRPEARTLLDAACGTGVHLSHLRDHFDVEGVDGSPAMLARARQRVPGAPLHEGDLRTFDLGRRFDAVTCLFSSIAYLVPAEELRRGVANLARHLVDGGVLVVEPWVFPDAWEPAPLPRVDSAEGEDLTVTRMTWVRTEGRRSLLDMHWLIGSPTGVEHVPEHHETFLYTDEEYREAFTAAGCSAELDPEGLIGRGLYVCVKGG
ncbi:MAG: class SAM-dependent methyltransferase [Acidimicrobiales bacterium]|nr:class SAM-dependent methyltransferase [Acidimicrobiales bacterium]